VSVPRVYSAIAAVVGELSSTGIAKRHVNPRDLYEYRSIDDLYHCLSPLLAKHRLCILPRILKRSVHERRDEHGGPIRAVAVKAAFDIVSAEDGTCHAIESFGEALDASDKATAKAITAAYKQAMFQVFCIPTGERDDAEALSLRLGPEHIVEPVEGWTQWGKALLDNIASCESRDAVDLVQITNRDLLRALAMHDVALYGKVGEAIRMRRRDLAAAQSPAFTNCAPSGGRGKRPSTARQKKVRANA